MFSSQQKSMLYVSRRHHFVLILNKILSKSGPILRIYHSQKWILLLLKIYAEMLVLQIHMVASMMLYVLIECPLNANNLVDYEQLLLFISWCIHNHKDPTHSKWLNARDCILLIYHEIFADLYSFLFGKET